MPVRPSPPTQPISTTSPPLAREKAARSVLLPPATDRPCRGRKNAPGHMLRGWRARTPGFASRPEGSHPRRQDERSTLYVEEADLWTSSRQTVSPLAQKTAVLARRRSAHLVDPTGGGEARRRISFAALLRRGSAPPTCSASPRSSRWFQISTTSPLSKRKMLTAEKMACRPVASIAPPHEPRWVPEAVQRPTT